MKKSAVSLNSVGVVNFFVDWAIKKKHVAIIEPVNSIINIQSATQFKFGSVKELLETIKQSVSGVSSGHELNCFLESGAPYLLLHQLIANGFNVFLVDGKEVNKFRGERKKSDKKDAKYIQELYRQNPELFKELAEPEKQDVTVRFLMAKYNHFTKALSRAKTQQKAYERQFGEDGVFADRIKDLEGRKKRALKEVLPFIPEELSKIDIKGIAETTIAQLLSAAHPKRFPTLSRYLAYCGYTANTYYKDPRKGYVKGNLRRHYSVVAKTTAWQMARNCIMQQKRVNGEWYQLYTKLKEDLRERFPEDSKAKVNGKAINRLSTFLLKEIYHILAEESKITV